MLCDIARNLSAEELERIRTLESDLGLTLLAYSCRSLAAEREARLLAAMREMGLPQPVEPAAMSAEQLQRIRDAELALGVSLVAVLA